MVAAALGREPQLSITNPGARKGLPALASPSKMQNPLFPITPKQVILEVLLLTTKDRGLFTATLQKHGKHLDTRMQPGPVESARAEAAPLEFRHQCACNGTCYGSQHKQSLKHRKRGQINSLCRNNYLKSYNSTRGLLFFPGTCCRRFTPPHLSLLAK